MKGLLVLSPVYNDWLSYARLLNESKAVLENAGITHYKFIAVDDCSSPGFEQVNDPSLNNLDVLTLTNNLGHQKAICAGLVYANENYSGYDVVVLDSDGEDLPENIPELMSKSRTFGNKIVFAQRTERSEGPVFTFFYKLYKVIFRQLTGKAIDFGNFSFLPAEYISRIVHFSDIWNHYSGGILKSMLPFERIPLKRGRRFEGKSKMNFTALVMHGLSAVSVYSDVMAVRLLLLSLVSIAISFIGICVIAGIRFFTPYAIPGWASSGVLGLVIIIFQAFLMGLFLTFTVLSARNQKRFIPNPDALSFIYKVYKL